jgi:hypothetical protein
MMHISGIIEGQDFDDLKKPEQQLLTERDAVSSVA